MKLNSDALFDEEGIEWLAEIYSRAMDLPDKPLTACAGPDYTLEVDANGTVVKTPIYENTTSEELDDQEALDLDASTDSVDGETDDSTADESTAASGGLFLAVLHAIVVPLLLLSIFWTRSLFAS